MAEESTDPLVTPEKNELDDNNISKNSAGDSGSPSNGGSTHAHHLRASIGSYDVGDSSIRNSIEKSDFANSTHSVVSRYLRASTGSCHDFCKYGRKHASEEKARKPLRKRIAKPFPNELIPVQIIVSGEQKKEKFVKHKPSIDAKNHSPDLNPSPDTKSYSTKPKTSLDKQKVVKHKPSTDTKKLSPNPKPSPGAKSYSRKPKTSLDAKTYSPRQNASSDNKSPLPKYKPSPSRKVPSPDPPEIIKRVISPTKNVELPVKQGSSNDNKMSRTERKTGSLSKELSSPVKSKAVNPKPSSSSDNGDGIRGKGSDVETGRKMIASKASAKKTLAPPAANLYPKPSSSSDNADGMRGKGRRNSDVETGRKMTASTASAKKTLAPPAATLSPKLSLNKTASIESRKAGKLASPLKDRNKTHKVKTNRISNKEKVFEKTLHVIKMETKNNVFVSTPDDNAISSLPSPSSLKSLSHAKSSSLSSHVEDDEETEHSGSAADEFISDNDESMEIGKVQPVKENHNKTLRKNRVVVSEGKNCSPVKLKFRSGKVVDLHSDNNGPRRLRFRRARILGAGDSKGDLRRRTFKKAGVNGDATGAEPQHSSRKVVLKHQGVQSKKDAQGLFNNVIEETASKLVESRKSKVKALVGAFETVISLQESKPTSQAVN